MSEEPEDWRARNACEGRAIFIPGKSVAQMKAEAAAEAGRRAARSRRAVELANGDWQELDTTIEDLFCLVGDLCTVCEMLGDLEQVQAADSAALLRIMARTLHTAQDRELQVLNRLDAAIRKANKGGKE